MENETDLSTLTRRVFASRTGPVKLGILTPVPSIQVLMRRREIIRICVGVPFLYPFAARAQPANKQFRIGLISPAGRTSTRLFDTFREKLQELGYHEGEKPRH